MSELTNLIEGATIKPIWTNVKIIVGVVGLILIIGLIWACISLNNRYTDSQIAKAAAETRYEGLKHEMELKEKSNAISEDTIKELKDQIANKDDQVDQISTNIDGKLAAITNKYKDLPRSSENQQAMEREISGERMRGLWLAYCIAKPTAAKCKN